MKALSFLLFQILTPHAPEHDYLQYLYMQKHFECQQCYQCVPVLNCHEYLQSKTTPITPPAVSASIMTTIVQPELCANKDFKEQCIPCICEHRFDFEFNNPKCSGCGICIEKIDCDKAVTTKVTLNQQPSVTVTTATKSTTTILLSTVMHTTTPGEHVCGKMQIIQALAEETQLKCDPSMENATSLFVRNKCNATVPINMWMPKRQVIGNCNHIKPYTAIGSMANGIFGSFIACENTSDTIGFAMAIQFCGKSTEIIHIPNNLDDRYFGMPDNYFTLTW